MTSLGLILVALLLAMLVFSVFSVTREIAAYVYWWFFLFVKKHQGLSVRHQNILRKYSAYFNMLAPKDKLRFQQRVQQFMFSKQFLPRVFEEVTDEMKVLISASAVQLTFGLPHIYLAHFDRIVVYPDSYYSTITKTYHVGEVNPRMGMIILSWKRFVEGYADITDTFNVGIHEMAHAIHFENRIKNEEFNFLDGEGLKQLDAITKREIPKLKSGESHFFRSYAGTNEYEFFAVALEYFFEKPVEFKSAIPDLYGVLTRLLNQDPIELYRLK